MIRYIVVNHFGKSICGPFADRETAQYWAEQYTIARNYACFVYECEYAEKR